MKLPSLSVILPNYNHGHLLPVCINAMISQSVPPSEIVIVDDGSTDDSVEVIKGLAGIHPIIKLYQNERNRGVSYTLNRGIEFASCEYMYFPAADDEVLPGFIEKSMALLAQYPRAGISCTIGDWRELGSGLKWHMGVGMADKPDYLSPKAIVELEKRGRFFIPNHTAIMKRSALIEAGKFIPELKSTSDWFANNVVALRYGLCIVPEPLAIFNIDANSYFHRNRRDVRNYRQMLETILNLLSRPEYRDVADLMREGGSLFLYGGPMLKLLLSRPEYRRFITPTFLRKNLWHSTKLILKLFAPAFLGNWYLRFAGYRAKAPLLAKGKTSIGKA